MKLLQQPSVAPPVPLTLGKALGAFYQRSLAKLAGYRAASPSATTTVGTRYATNSNSASANIQRAGLMFTAEDVCKNTAIGEAYLAQRRNYCSRMIRYIPNTGDEKLNEDLKMYLQGEDGVSGAWSRMGVNCSMQDAFLRSADIELPVRGDSGMAWFRDSRGNLKLMEFSADQLGEPYQYTAPQKLSDGTTYFCGKYMDASGEVVAYKVYERIDAWYGNPRIFPASDVIYFQDPASFRGMRGVTKFANALQHMEKGEALFQIGMDAAMRQAKTAFFATNARGESDEQTYETALSENQFTLYERLGNGPVTQYGYTGDTMQAMSADSPGEELINGCEFSDERVALALGLTYSFLLSPKLVGGAPSRLDINKVTNEFTRIQDTIHRPALNKIKIMTILDAIANGIFPPIPTIMNGRFELPVSPTVDAYYDAKENVQMLRSGLESPQEICAETNRNWTVVLKQKTQAAVEVAKATQDANKLLKNQGYEGNITTNDLMQLTDNPQPAQTQLAPTEAKQPAQKQLAA